jgi:transmembrane sensor
MSIRRDNMESRISDQTADEAGAWDARLRAPDCTEADRERFAQWRDLHPSNRLAFERLQTIVGTLRNETGRADVRALRDAALRSPKQHWWDRLAQDEDYARTRKLTVTAAAAVALLAIGVTIWTTLPETVRRDPLRELAAVAERISDYALAQTYQTGIGQRSTITLADGSTVELNAKTRIKVSFNETRRNVVLVGGQALFHVAKNPQRPFIVRAGDRDIVAVGTAFDVRLDATSVRVTLIEGKVKVSQEPNDRVSTHTQGEALSEGTEGEVPSPLMSKERERKGNPLPAATQGEALSEGRSGSGEIYLTPGQQFVAHLSTARERSSGNAPLQVVAGAGSVTNIPEQNAVVRTVEIAKITGWRDGRVFLEDLTLADAVTEMNKYSQVQIRVDDPQLARLRVNGMFRVGEQDAFVTALQDYFPIAANRDGDTEIALTRRD